MSFAPALIWEHWSFEEAFQLFVAADPPPQLVFSQLHLLTPVVVKESSVARSNNDSDVSWRLAESAASPPVYCDFSKHSKSSMFDFTFRSLDFKISVDKLFIHSNVPFFNCFIFLMCCIISLPQTSWGFGDGRKCRWGSRYQRKEVYKSWNEIKGQAFWKGGRGGGLRSHNIKMFWEGFLCWGFWRWEGSNRVIEFRASSRGIGMRAMPKSRPPPYGMHSEHFALTQL